MFERKKSEDFVEIIDDFYKPLPKTITKAQILLVIWFLFKHFY